MCIYICTSRTSRWNSFTCLHSGAPADCARCDCWHATWLCQVSLAGPAFLSLSLLQVTRARTGQDSLHWIPSLRYSAGLTRLLHLLHVAQLLELVLTVLTSSQGVLRRMVSSRFRLQLRSCGRAWSGLGGQHARAASASRAAYLRRPLRLTQGLCSFTERRERRSSGAAAGLGRTQAQIRPQGQLIRTGALRKPRLVALPCSMCS